MNGMELKKLMDITVSKSVKEFSGKVKDYINDLAVDEFRDNACDIKYLTINIDDFMDKIDELANEYEVKK